MSLGLRVDDSDELPSMENWLNAGADWTEHHGIDLTPSESVEELFYEEKSSLFEAGARPFLKLDALELCKETGSSSLVDSSSIEEDGVVANSRLRLMEAESPRGPLSPAALKSSKRSFDDLSYAVPAMASTPAAFLPPPNGTILFPAPLTLPSMPSMEEIAQSRPKRRNVKISTDPQSVAARHRRERISDRVRVLQHFVPGGTKMDTASMLDEAIHYVKFLQQQLQKLERLGNSYDARFMSGGAGAMMPQASSSSTLHPFDLNYCTLPYPTMMQQTQQQQHQQQAQNVNTTWSFPDSGQEQFCH